jgi:uncharacterized membrane protein
MAFKLKNKTIMSIVKSMIKAGRERKKELKQAKKVARKEQKDRFKSGDITRKRFKDIKKEIRKYKDY